MRVLVVIISILGAALSMGAGAPWIERLGVALLARQIGTDPQTMLDACMKRGISVYDQAPAFLIKSRSNADLDEIIRLRRSGLAWSDVAQRVGLQPSALNRLRVRGELSEETLWQVVLRDRCSISERELDRLRKKKLDWPNIAAISFISMRANVDPERVRKRFEQEGNWPRVCKALGVEDDFNGGRWSIDRPGKGRRGTGGR